MGRFYGNIEEANAEAAKKAALYREAASYYPTLVKVFKQFDKKVYNCRLEKALMDATGKRVFCSKEYSCINVHFYDRGNRITLAYLNYKDMPDEKRINAAKLIESAQSCREELLKQAYDIDTYIETIPALKAYLNEMKTKLEKQLSKIPSDIRDIYGLPHYIRFD